MHIYIRNILYRPWMHTIWHIQKHLAPEADGSQNLDLHGLIRGGMKEPILSYGSFGKLFNTAGQKKERLILSWFRFNCKGPHYFILYI